MDEQTRLEIAARIKDLRERSRYTQPELADKLGLTLRGYQKLEQRGTTKYERVEEIAKIHDEDPDWIWDGRRRGVTPDVLAALDGDGHGNPDDFDARFDSFRAEVLAHLSILRQAEESIPRAEAIADLHAKLDQIVERQRKLEAGQVELRSGLAQVRTELAGLQKPQRRGARKPAASGS